MPSPKEEATPGLAAKALRRTADLLSSKGKPLVDLSQVATNPSNTAMALQAEKKPPRLSTEAMGNALGTFKRRLSIGRAKPKRASVALDTFGSAPQPLHQCPASSERSLSISPVGEAPLPLSAIEEKHMSTCPDDVKVPLLLQVGIPMLKVSEKNVKTRTFRIDPDQGLILWDSKKSGIIVMENIKEMRACEDGRYYRERFKLSSELEERWLTIVYLADGKYKTLHLVAMTKDHFTMWHETLKKLYAIRAELMTGLGNMERRQTLWERHYWKGADFSGDHALDFEEVKRMCRRLNISTDDAILKRRFDAADSKKSGKLDFEDFRRFVKGLKRRPEIKRLFRVWKRDGDFTFTVFEKFMHESQQEELNKAELEVLFRKYATPFQTNKPLPPIPFPSADAAGSITLKPESHAPSLPKGASPAPSKSVTPSGSHSHLPATSQTIAALAAIKPAIRATYRRISLFGHTRASTSAPSAHAHPAPIASTPENALAASPIPDEPNAPIPLEYLTFSLECFTTFLLSADNSPFTDYHGKIYQDMNRPISEYYISSSHNTYLVGHQLVGVSTIEGYIRALLQSCRSVEIDIYDGDEEPVITHGKTLTSKVPLRDICEAINKYAFVTSPYPIIISAEVHCGLEGQDMIAEIMKETFGKKLVDAHIQGHDLSGEDAVLPSPEQLKKKILLKTKNLYISDSKEKGAAVDAESSTESTSEYDADPSKSPLQSRSKSILNRVGRRMSKASGPQYTPTKEALITSPVSPTSPFSSKELGLVINSRDAAGAATQQPKVRMSMALAALLVYTVGVKYRGINKKERYAIEHMFSLSENTANKFLKRQEGAMELIKHNRSHLVRIYPRGTRLRSTNYEPHRYWASGAQLVAMNWQTFDLGYMINHSMFQRNGRAGYLLKPEALRSKEKNLLMIKKMHCLNIKVISAQQLPRPRDENGREIMDKSIIDPFVQVSVHIPDWVRPGSSSNGSNGSNGTPSPNGNESKRKTADPEPLVSSPLGDIDPSVILTPNSGDPNDPQLAYARPARVISSRTGVIKDNGFNPVWEELVSITFDVVGDMKDLVFVRFTIKDEGDDEENRPIAVYCSSLGSLRQGYRHLPLYDQQLSQYLFSTLFVQIELKEVISSSKASVTLDT